MLEPYIVFQVAGSNYAVRAAQVQQVEMVENITHVPNAPDYVEGIVYLRNQIVPVINLRERFRMGKIPYDLRARLIVFQIDERTIGMAVDAAREFFWLDRETFTPPPESLTGSGIEYLEGVCSQNNRLILVVNLHRLLSQQEQDLASEFAAQL
jgi:purine-binding chemotaxis protein CheW